jgi:hypothetical protein
MLVIVVVTPIGWLGVFVVHVFESLGTGQLNHAADHCFR